MSNNSIFSMKNVLVFGLMLAGASAGNFGTDRTKGTAFHVQTKKTGSKISGSTHSGVRQNVHSASVKKKSKVRDQSNKKAWKGKKAERQNYDDEESNYNENDSNINQYDQENSGVYEDESNPNWGNNQTITERHGKKPSLKRYVKKQKSEKSREKREKSHEKKCDKKCEKKCDKHDVKKCDKHDEKKCDKHDVKKCDKHDEKKCDKHDEKKCDKKCEKKCDKHDEKKCDKHEEKKCEKSVEKKCEKSVEKKCEKREEKHCDRTKKCCDTNLLLVPVQAGQKKQCVNRAYLDNNNCCVEVDGNCKCWKATGVCKQCYVGYKVDCKDPKKCVLA